VQAIALLPRVRRLASTQPIGDCAGSPSNDTRSRVSVVGLAPGPWVWNALPVNVLTSEWLASSVPSWASISASWYCWVPRSPRHDTVAW
jgi:hypothetical protein